MEKTCPVASLVPTGRLYIPALRWSQFVACEFLHVAERQLPAKPESMKVNLNM